MRTILQLTTVFFLASSPCAAFDHDGFVLGMGKEAAANLAKSRGLMLRSLKIPGMSLLSSGDRTIATINFCDGYLFSYATDLTAGVESFIRAVDREKSEFGSGELKTQVSVTRDGEEYLSLSVRWKRGSYDRSITYSNIAGYEQVSREDRNSTACAD